MLKHVITTINLDDEVVISKIPVYNTFQAFENRTLFERLSIYGLMLILSLLFMVIYLTDWSFIDAAQNKKFDKMAITVVDFGDFTALRRKYYGGRKIVEIDEVFGNQYIKKKDEKIDPNAEYTTDPRIAGAVNPVIGNATAPIDLAPTVRPQYTAAARAAGVEGMVMLELVIGDKGRVLRARPVGRRLGYGLDEAAAATYKQKKYKPSINSDGKRITVKIIQPVRFVLF